MTSLLVLGLFAWLFVPVSLWVGFKLWQSEKPKADSWRQR
jgi:hypothetical protein